MDISKNNRNQKMYETYMQLRSFTKVAVSFGLSVSHTREIVLREIRFHQTGNELQSSLYYPFYLATKTEKITRRCFNAVNRYTKRFTMDYEQFVSDFQDNSMIKRNFGEVTINQVLSVIENEK